MRLLGTTFYHIKQGESFRLDNSAHANRYVKKDNGGTIGDIWVAIRPSCPVFKRQDFALYDTLPFGKYKGSTIKEIIEDDPSYIEWCQDAIDDFELNDSAADYLEETLNGTEQDDA